MKLADDIANRPRRFLRLGSGRQTQFTHRVNNAALHGFQTVADGRQRAIENNVHRIIEVGFLGVFLEGLLFYALEIKTALHSIYTSAKSPLVSSHLRRSFERFLASSMSMS